MGIDLAPFAPRARAALYSLTCAVEEHSPKVDLVKPFPKNKTEKKKKNLKPTRPSNQCAAAWRSLWAASGVHVVGVPGSDGFEDAHNPRFVSRLSSCVWSSECNRWGARVKVPQLDVVAASD